MEDFIQKLREKELISNDEIYKIKPKECIALLTTEENIERINKIMEETGHEKFHLVTKFETEYMVLYDDRLFFMKKEKFEEMYESYWR